VTDDHPKSEVVAEAAHKPGLHYVTAIAVGVLITIVAVADLIIAEGMVPAAIYFVLGSIAIGAPDLVRYWRGGG
jgi:hypothetical protein